MTWPLPLGHGPGQGWDAAWAISTADGLIS